MCSLALRLRLHNNLYRWCGGAVRAHCRLRQLHSLVRVSNCVTLQKAMYLCRVSACEHKLKVHKEQETSAGVEE